MSYDYMLMRGSAGAGLDALAEGAMSHTIGKVESVKASLHRLFPSLRWNESQIPDLLAWFGRSDNAEFQLIAEANGQVRMISMSRCERADVERVAKELGLVAIDEQSMEQFGG